MSIHVSSSYTHRLSDPTQFFGLKLWIVIVICVVLLLIVTLLFVSLCSSSCLWRRQRRRRRNSDNKYCLVPRHMMDGRLLSRRGLDNPSNISSREDDQSNWSRSSIHLVDMPPMVIGGSGRCKKHSASEIELATEGFSHENMVGNVENRVVYRGDERVALKILMSNSKVEEFLHEVEVIWGIRHNNLVKLIGCSVDGTKRTLVYEYVDNGNLHQWLHQCVARINPLTWNIRMGIILGITKGLAYLHEDSDPKVIHQHLKSNSILLDRQWNPKISDIGITKLLGLEHDLFKSRNLVGMSGYIDPEYISTRNFDEKSDVYSFGVLVMEIITGRTSVRYNESNKKDFLVDWLKLMVSNQRFDEIVDQRLQEPPSIKELKRIILIALRCVDPDIENRPTMGEVIHMLEPRDLLLDDDYVIV